MLYLCLTFDYELFLGKNNFTEKEILFEPTEKLVAMLSAEKVSATFFADMCSVIQYDKMGLNDYVIDFEEQLRKLYAEGNDVQLHIHPHWMNSVYSVGEWKYNYENYRIQSLGFERDKKDSGFDILQTGIERLNTILRKINGDYCCIAYRAGGFALQPHQELISALYDCGIRIDSSVAPHLVSESKTNFYNYENKYIERNWWISPSHDWWDNRPDDPKALYEVPIATENKNPITFGLRKIFKPDTIKFSSGQMKGSYVNSGEGKRKRINLWNYLSGYNALSLDAYHADFLYKQILRYYRDGQCDEKDVYVALIGHPKLITDSYISNARNLIDLIKGNSNIQIVNIYNVYQKEVYSERIKTYNNEEQKN